METIRKQVIIIVSSIICILLLVMSSLCWHTQDDVFTQTINQCQKMKEIDVTVKYAIGDKHIVNVLIEVHLPQDISLNGRIQGMILDAKNVEYSYEYLGTDVDSRIQYYNLIIDSSQSLIGKKFELSVYNYYENHMNKTVSETCRFSFKINSFNSMYTHTICKTIDSNHIDEIVVTPMIIAVHANEELIFHDNMQLSVVTTDNTLYETKPIKRIYGSEKIAYYLLKDINMCSVSKVIINEYEILIQEK